MLTTVTPENRAEWLEERRNSLGSSDCAAALGLSPYKTPLGLYLEKTGQAPPTEENLAMRLGTMMEPIIGQLYEEWAEEQGEPDPIEETQVFVRSEEMPFLTATLDARTANGNVLEFKRVGHRSAHLWGEAGTGEVPPFYACQVLHQMLVTGRSEVRVAALIDDELRVYPVARHDKVLARMRVMLSDFWRRVERRDPPPPSEPSDAELMRWLYPRAEGEIVLDVLAAEQVERYEELGRHIKDLTEQRQRTKALVLDTLGNAASGTLPDGRILTRRIVEVEERTQKVKAYSYVDLRIKKGVK